MAHPWEPVEAEIVTAMTFVLAEYANAAAELENLAFQILSATIVLRQPQDIYHAHASLLTRTLHDLRACVLLSLRGYTMQAWTVAASGFEAAHSIGFIGEDVIRANRWMQHHNLQRGSWSAYDAVNNCVHYLGMTTGAGDRERVARAEYELYERLCIGKHVNPLAERERYLSIDTGKLSLSPRFNLGRAKEARLGLATICRATSMGIWAFRKAHLDQDHPLDPQIIAIAECTSGLAENWNSDADINDRLAPMRLRNGT